MKKWIYMLLAIVLVLSIAVFLWYRRPYDDWRDDACVPTLKTYSKNIIEFQNNLRQKQNQLAAERAKSGSSVAPLPTPIQIPPPILDLSLITFDQLRKLLLSLECTSMPMPVQSGNMIGDYPFDGLQKPLPAPCTQAPILYHAADLPKLDKIPDLAASVGRIEIRNEDLLQTNPEVPPVMLGSGFLIARGTFVVSCHVIAPLLKIDPNLQLGNSEKLVVDFEPTRQSMDPTKEFDVKGFLGCSQRSGLDVALLDLCPQSDRYCQAPDPRETKNYLRLLQGGPDDIKKITTEFSILIGYADLDHFIDPVKRAIYDPFVAYSYLQNDPSARKRSSGKLDSPNPNGIYEKFLLIDNVASEDECGDDKKLGIVLDTVSTTVGESGSVVIDLHEPVFIPPQERARFDKSRANGPDKKPVVVGMHTCCSAFFENDYGKPPDVKLPCARLHRTFHNQDISSWSILGDAALCPILKDRDVTVVDINDTAQPLVCR